MRIGEPLKHVPAIRTKNVAGPPATTCASRPTAGRIGAPSSRLQISADGRGVKSLTISPGCDRSRGFVSAGAVVRLQCQPGAMGRTMAVECATGATESEASRVASGPDSRRARPGNALPTRHGCQLALSSAVGTTPSTRTYARAIQAAHEGIDEHRRAHKRENRPRQTRHRGFVGGRVEARSSPRRRQPQHLQAHDGSEVSPIAHGTACGPPDCRKAFA